jgi:hypothetical protein
MSVDAGFTKKVSVRKMQHLGEKLDLCHFPHAQMKLDNRFLLELSCVDWLGN